MTLNHSKTWPVSTLAVVQLRVDPHGRTYSTFPEREAETAPDLLTVKEHVHQFLHNEQHQCTSENDSSSRCNNNGILSQFKRVQCDLYQTFESPESAEAPPENGIILPLSKKHVELFTKMSSAPTLKTTIRTDTVSTILEQDVDYESEKHQDVSGKPSHHVQVVLFLTICIFAGNNNKSDANQFPLEKFHVLALTRIEENVAESECHVHGVGRRPSIKVDNWDFIYTEAGVNKPPPRCPVHRPAPEGNANTNASKTSFLPELPLDARKTTTLRRHYYPEGGWGWVIIVCAVLVHILNHGVQLSYSELISPGVQKFKVEPVHFAGR